MIAGMMIPAKGVLAHEEGAEFSGAIIEPLRVHHAHIENEQRLNASFMDGFREEEGGKRSAYSGSLEAAFKWGDSFRWGSEILIPFSNTGLDREDYGVGDIELWPVKFAFINEPETIVSAVIGLELPTGDESKGLGEDRTALGGLLFFDHAYRNWFFGLNTELLTSVSGETETELELASVVSYSMIRETGEGSAPPKPDQAIVPSLSLEVVSEYVLSGDEKGSNIIEIIPGLHFWHPESEWAIRFGLEVPVSLEKEKDWALLVQVGNHFNWGGILK